jgi:hypothetical protein
MGGTRQNWSPRSVGMHGRTARASIDECAQRATTLTMRELAQQYLAARRFGG